MENHLTGTYQLCDGDSVLNDDEKLSPDRALTACFRLEEVNLSRRHGRLKLHQSRTKRYFHVTVYLDETVADAKELLRHSHNFGDVEILIGRRAGLPLEDDDLLWNLDLSLVYELAVDSKSGSPLSSRLTHSPG
jgi:hypothetical protein